MNREASGTLWDGRVEGAHGIARFAREVYTRLDPRPDAWKGKRPPYSALAPLEAARALRAADANLLLSPTYAVALPGPYRQVVTVHDLILLSDPHESSLLKRTYFDRLVRPAIARSGLVMTVSEYSQREIARWAGLELDQVVVVGNGCSMPLLPDATTARRARQSDPYVLFVGNDRPHKNFVTLARAMASIQADARLVTVGVSPDSVARLADGTGLDVARVDIRMGLDDQTLQALYTNASVLSVPSTVEGFGLIALEAAARGVPTVYSCDALAEVLGTTGIRSGDPFDHHSLAASLRDALGSTPDHSALVARAASFRWEDVALRVGEVWQRALSS